MQLTHFFNFFLGQQPSPFRDLKHRRKRLRFGPSYQQRPYTERILRERAEKRQESGDQSRVGGGESPKKNRG